MGTTKLLHV